MIKAECSGCGASFKAKPEHVGKTLKCPKCGGRVMVKSDEAPAARPASAGVSAAAPKASAPRQQAAKAATSKPARPPAVPPAVPSAAPVRRVEPAPPPPVTVEAGHAAAVPTINVNMPRRTSSLGIVSLILGAIAFLICWIPFINLLSVPVAFVGLILGIVGFIVALRRKASGIGFPIGGTVLCGLALIVAGLVNLALFGAAKATVDVADSIARQQQQKNATNQQVVPTSTGAPNGAEMTDAAGETWADASAAVQQGDVSVKVDRVAIGKIGLEAMSGANSSKEELMAIYVTVTNTSATRKVEYRTWAGAPISAARDFATLKDDHNNSYNRIDFGIMTRPVGRVGRDSVYPGKSVTDVLVFEKAIDTAGNLFLELPAKNFDGEGMIRFKIPVSMIGLLR